MIILISKDASAIESIKNILGENYKIGYFTEFSRALFSIRSKPPRLVILDVDIDKNSGLKLFRSVQEINPALPVIMISESADYSLVVSAAKQGVLDFLKKPLEACKLSASVKNAINANEPSPFLSGMNEIPWLFGESALLKNFLQEIKNIAASHHDAVVGGEGGVDKYAIAELIHKNTKPAGTIKTFSFSRDAEEHYFLTALQDILSRKDNLEIETRVTTLFLSDFLRLHPLTQKSLSLFLKTRKKDLRYDAGIRIIVEAGHENPGIKGIDYIHVPPLRNRKADLAAIIHAMIAKYSREFNKSVNNVGLDLIPFFTDYYFPGNYVELKELIKGGILRCQKEILTLDDLPLTDAMHFLSRRKS